MLTRTGRKLYRKNINFALFSCIIFALTSVTQTTLNKQCSTRKNVTND